MERCKICGKQFSNVYIHAKTKHGLTKEDYDAVEISDVSEEAIPEAPKEIPEEKETITPKEMTEGIFGKDEDIMLSEFLKKYDIGRKDLIALIKRYKEGSSIPVTQMQEMRHKKAQLDAESLKDRDEIKVNSVVIAESLVKEHGFEVVAVLSGPPRMWHLKKRDS
jgi:hypothetical protein